MKLIAVEIARATQVFINEEIRPLSGAYFPESVRLVTERYGFAASPTDPEASSAKFSTGRLISGTRRINISDATIFQSAVQVTTVTNTDEADYVVDDMMSWAINALAFREPQTIFPRHYESALIVEFDREVDNLLRPFENLRAGFQRSLDSAYDLNSKVSFATFAISSDPLQLAGQLLPPLSNVLKPELGLVRRANAPFSANRFFSLAPLKTEAHRLLLEEFEQAIPGMN
jgi:hypothetical protein